MEEVPVTDPSPEIQEWMNEEVSTSEELTDEAIVHAILNPFPEPEQIEDDEDDQEAEALKRFLNHPWNRLSIPLITYYSN